MISNIGGISDFAEMLDENVNAEEETTDDSEDGVEEEIDNEMQLELLDDHDAAKWPVEWRNFTENKNSKLPGKKHYDGTSKRNIRTLKQKEKKIPEETKVRTQRTRSNLERRMGDFLCREDFGTSRILVKTKEKRSIKGSL